MKVGDSSAGEEFDLTAPIDTYKDERLLREQW